MKPRNAWLTWSASGPDDRVRAVGYGRMQGIAKQRGQPVPGDLGWRDPVLGALNDQHRDGDPGQLQLDYGEWLRRQRRINDAKPVLAAALETLRSLGATPWIRRAEAELRACGVTTQAAATTPGALADLTPQQRQIVILAGRGLTNGEIADRLFLSPRTVASHLYNLPQARHRRPPPTPRPHRPGHRPASRSADQPIDRRQGPIPDQP